MEETPSSQMSPRGASPKWPRYLFGIVMIGMWLSSLFVPAAHFVRSGPPIGGVDVLFLGWMGVASFQPAWLANPILLIVLPASVFSEKPGGCLIKWGGIALALLALAAVFWQSWPLGTDYDSEIRFGPGFYLWISAVGGTAVLALARTLAAPAAEKEE